eukprot:15347090-Ditylum_brightwellii.AAC.1
MTKNTTKKTTMNTATDTTAAIMTSTMAMATMATTITTATTTMTTPKHQESCQGVGNANVPITLFKMKKQEGCKNSGDIFADLVKELEINKNQKCGI